MLSALKLTPLHAYLQGQPNVFPEGLGFPDEETSRETIPQGRRNSWQNYSVGLGDWNG